MDPKELEQVREVVVRILTRKGKRLRRQLAEWELQLAKAKNWEELFHQGKLLQSRFFELKRGEPSITVADWNNNMEPKTIILDPLLEPQDNLKLIFKQSKKLQKAIPHLERHLLQKTAEIEQHQVMERLAETTMDIEFLQQWLPKPSQPKKKEAEKAIPYLEFTSPTGVLILVGKNSRANDKLTFQIAHGTDWWMHAAGYAGSHVVIRDKNPDQATLDYAMALAVEHSKAKKCGEAEVVVTQRKFVAKAPGGKPGQVQISQHKNYYKRIR